MSDTLLDLIGRLSTYQDKEGDDSSVVYRAMLAPEGIETSDGRFIQEGALTWRDGPLSLMWSDTEMGHGDAVHVGNLLNLRKETVDGVVWVVADVDWDLNEDNESAPRAKRLVDEDRLNGVSIHMADMEADFECDDNDENCLLTVTMGVIAAATIVAIPAFADAEIEAVTAAGVDLYQPPREWFNDPQLTELTHTAITDDGRIYGHVTPGQDTCHLAYPFSCVRPPKGHVDYDEFNVHARVGTDDGQLIPVGVLSFDGGHASTDKHLTSEQVLSLYDSSTTVGAYVRAGEDEHGTWIAGAISHNLTKADIETLRRLSLSGDWRPGRDGGSVFAAALAVPVPGFSIKALVAAGVPHRTITVGPAPAQDKLPDLVLVATAIQELRDVVGEFRQDMEPLLAERRAVQLAAALAKFG